MVSDVEKDRVSSLQSVTQDGLEFRDRETSAFTSRYQRWARNIKGLETRGIEPVPLDERLEPNASNSLHMLLMWFSMGMSLNNIVVGSLGTLTLHLSYSDAALCAVFGSLLGGLAVGWMSTWGPRSGNRTLIVARYFMGYHPSKVCCTLNILTNLGYGMMNCMIGGQLLSKLSGGAVSVIVGIIIVALASWIMATFGVRIFQIYERFAWVPQLMVLCIIIGSAGPYFNFDNSSVGSSEKLHGNRLAFFSFCLSVALSWVPLASDYYVNFPPSTRKWKIWSMTTIGLCLSMMTTLLLGAGLGSGVAYRPKWAAIYDGSPGSLLMAGYLRLGAFGKFCAVINVVTVVSNNAPGSYSMAMNFQMLGNMWRKIPRPIFTILTTITYAACAIGGRNSLYEIFKNFLPLIGYWVIIWFAIVVEQDLLFNRGIGYDWSIWNVRQKLPVGMAASAAFLIGWVGAIVGMDQAYYTGPIAQTIEGGCDLGIWLGFGFAALAFPPLRLLELKIIGR
ncbi:putative purine-cytosine permease [Aspergillus steynii IBT 23096]|uniref:Putative purine-cytosine permease n=1 Tax=Aspergillus steynii IBT 23096 TaxID=1392250 RepID=A0A2I2FT64_9EURO|nr:putative purine-cytosine permease [Aspergillus steynii IBT 23096]PLB43812.1 putative purine-cytosine permease [Aspergillus steynii IBT 23096]